MVRRAVEQLLSILEVDRRTMQGRQRYDRKWPVVLSVPLTPMEYDALRFLSSLYPANPSEILRGSVLRALDPGVTPPAPREGGPDPERTARVELGLELWEAERLEELASKAGVGRETMVRWAMVHSLGPLLEVHRPR